MQANFQIQHPEIVAYEEARNIYLMNNPELIPFAIGEDNKLQGASPEVQAEVYQYRGEKASQFPMIDLKNDYYWTLTKSRAEGFLTRPC